MLWGCLLYRKVASPCKGLRKLLQSGSPLSGIPLAHLAERARQISGVPGGALHRITKPSGGRVPSSYCFSTGVKPPLTGVNLSVPRVVSVQSLLIY